MIHLTESAADELRRLMAERGEPDALVRFGVETGGCSGMQYSMDFERQARAADHVYDQNGVRVVCDRESLGYLEGLQVDFSRKLMGGGFKFHNPKAKRSCGCGTSFRI
ncbi:MAG: iron-sulfur cluster assembly accessory protein [Candidatus Krumholzibacteriia bacterium]